MLFHSFTFLYFFAAVLALHALAPHGLRRFVLLAASYAFYGYWNPRYAGLLLLSTVIDYFAAIGVARAKNSGRRKLLLIVSLACNLGLLAAFKYYNFFAHSLHDLLGLRLPLHELLLPVGISFYTFQSMSYTLDVYRRRIPLARDFVEFALYVSFFPQLVAGPIVRASEFLPQLGAYPGASLEQAREGLKRFCFGLFKKLVLADNLALLVDAIHAAPASHSAADLWIGAYAFAFQIYCDFSAYSDMAIGTAKMLGYEFDENFRRPYCARNPSEFWRRWHISLSSWLRDYLYIPLGGSRGGALRTQRNLMLTMLLGGLWHGANWTFVVWGLLHGAFLIVHRAFGQLQTRSGSLRRLAASPLLVPVFVLLTFHGWVLSMVFFRADSVGEAASMLARMASWRPGIEASASVAPYLALCLGLYAAQVSQEFYDLLHGFDRLPLAVRTAVIVLGAWVLVVFAPAAAEPFIYFQF